MVHVLKKCVNIVKWMNQIHDYICMSTIHIFIITITTMSPPSHEKSRCWPPKNQVVYQATSKHVGCGGPWYDMFGSKRWSGWSVFSTCFTISNFQRVRRGCRFCYLDDLYQTRWCVVHTGLFFDKTSTKNKGISKDVLESLLKAVVWGKNVRQQHKITSNRYRLPITTQLSIFKKRPWPPFIPYVERIDGAKNQEPHGKLRVFDPFQVVYLSKKPRLLGFCFWGSIWSIW